jgi:CRISPR-associated protein Cmr2
VRDLWTGSYLLSWLTFRAMQPVLDHSGPRAFVTPSLDDDRSAKPGLSACLPNSFLAAIPDDPAGTVARTLAAECEKACRDAWKCMSEVVRSGLNEWAHRLDSTWDRFWDDQIADFFEIRTAVLPLSVCDNGALRRLLGTSYDEGRRHALWWGRVQLAARLMEATRSAGHLPRYRPRGDALASHLRHIGRLPRTRGAGHR